ncbi:MAG: hypothetical protein M3350_03185 [Actinomycetota bacterium]|nr:hypothetical protein [Actinomycetota bacterium]
MQRAHSLSTSLLSAMILVLGLAMIVGALARGGGVVLGVVLGLGFVGIGAGRLWIARATSER